MKPSLVVIAELENRVITTPTIECLQEAHDVAVKVGATVRAILIGDGIIELAGSLAAQGADEIILVEHKDLSLFSADRWLSFLPDLLKEIHPAIIIAPDSSRSRAWLPKLAVRWPSPMVSSCIGLDATAEGQIEAIRPLYDGALVEHIVFRNPAPLIITFQPQFRGVAPPVVDHQSEVIHYAPELDGLTSRDRTIRMIPPNPQTVDLREADRIVSGGLGTGGPRGITLVERLADCLAASVGATRPVVDRGWLPLDREIGVTGRMVTPRLYVALGISGATQHVMGMAESEVIIAINLDPTAPIFELADLGVVGDLHLILPELLRLLDDRGEKWSVDANDKVEMTDG